jgi:hypothetical protein
MVASLSTTIERAAAASRISASAKRFLYKDLLLLLMGEPLLSDELETFCITERAKLKLSRLLVHLGKDYRLPKALYARVAIGMSLKNVRQHWHISAAEVKMINNVIRAAEVFPYNEHKAMLANYKREEFNWLPEVEALTETVEVIIDNEAIENLLISAFETYRVPHRGKRFTEVFGLCLGTVGSHELFSRGVGKHTKWVVYIQKAIPQLRAVGGEAFVRPSDKSVGALCELADSLFPHFEIVADFHSHPYKSLEQLRNSRGWMTSNQDDRGIEVFARRLRNAKNQRPHNLRLTLVIAIGKARGKTTPRRSKANVLSFQMAGCRIYIAGYRILSGGQTTSAGICLQRRGEIVTQKDAA